MKTPYTETELIKIALWLDDPYGDGIRLSAIRNPSPDRQAAIEFLTTGQRSIDSRELVYINAAKYWISKSPVTRRRTIERQGILVDQA
jgi:hypothetical protein